METREVRGDNPETMLECRNCAITNLRDPCTCGQQKTADCIGLPMLAQSMHWCRCMNERRPLMDALAQVPPKTPLGMKER